MPHPTLPKINSLSELRHKFSSESQNTNHQVVFKISYIIQNNSPTENPVSTLIVHWNAAALNDDNNLNESETQRGKTKIPRGQREAAPIWSRRRTARPSTTTLPAAKTAELCLARNGGPARDRTHAPATRERERGIPRGSRNRNPRFTLRERGSGLLGIFGFGRRVYEDLMIEDI